MRIGLNIPFQVARAYGAHAMPKAPAIDSAGSIRPATENAPAQRVAPNESIQKLIGGAVRGGVDFDAASTATRPAGPVLQLYTRAADRIEAATGVQLGRTLDVTG